MSLNIIIASANDTFIEEITNIDELHKNGYSLIVVSEYNEIESTIKNNKPFLLITDLWLTDKKKGQYTSTYDQELVKNIRSSHPNLQVIVFSDSRYPYIAYELYQAGALAYFPSLDINSLRTLINKAQLYHEVLDLTVSKTESSSILDKLIDSDYCVVKNSKLEEVYKKSLRYSATDSPVLILGETGTGKEHLASFIHNNSNRKSARFIPLDLSTIPDNLIESTLFGSKKGAFTNSTQDVVGIVADAEGGTLFMDEIGNVSTTIQSKLLRLVEKLEYRRVGDKTVLKANIRIITATNKNKIELENGSHFKRDLYYRLSAVTLNLPALRERNVKEKIHLANFFLKRISIQNNRVQKKLDKTALKFIVEYHWPGNIREIQKVLFNAVMETEEEIISGKKLITIINET